MYYPVSTIKSFTIFLSFIASSCKSPERSSADSLLVVLESLSDRHNFEKTLASFTSFPTSPKR
jgi:hypothetical protein